MQLATDTLMLVGGGPAANYFFLLRQDKVIKKKATPVHSPCPAVVAAQQREPSGDAPCGYGVPLIRRFSGGGKSKQKRLCRVGKTAHRLLIGCGRNAPTTSTYKN
jgi:hypothetical protein